MLTYTFRSICVLIWGVQSAFVEVQLWLCVSTSNVDLTIRQEIAGLQ